MATIKQVGEPEYELELDELQGLRMAREAPLRRSAPRSKSCERTRRCVGDSWREWPVIAAY
jgi:hypothetical protein